MSVDQLLGEVGVDQRRVENRDGTSYGFFTAPDGRDGLLWLEARGGQSIAHLSFVITHGSHEDLRAVKRRLPRPLCGELDLQSGDGWSYLRLVDRFAMDDGWEFGRRFHWLREHSSDVERAMTADLARGKRSVTQMLNSLADAGLAAPPMPAPLGARLVTLGPWWWSTRIVNPFDMYMFDLGEPLRFGWDGRPMFALSHAGHGINSYGLNLLVACGPVAASVQHGWGGAYMQPVRSRESIASTYARLSSLVQAVSDLPGPARWLVEISTFRGVCSLSDLNQVRSASHPADQPNDAFGLGGVAFEDESDLFAAVAGNFPEVRFNIGVDIEW